MTATDQTATLVRDLPAASATAAPSTPTRLTRMLCASGAIGVWASAMSVVYVIDPNKPGNPYPGCLLKETTGLDCPGCGGTRAMHALLQGDVGLAADHYLPIFLLLPVALYLTLRYILSQFDVTIPAPRMTRSMGWALAISMMVFTVARNLPIEPLSFLSSDLA
jgi:hypothetical protein